MHDCVWTRRKKERGENGARRRRDGMAEEAAAWRCKERRACDILKRRASREAQMASQKVDTKEAAELVVAPVVCLLHSSQCRAELSTRRCVGGQPVQRCTDVEVGLLQQLRVELIVCEAHRTKLGQQRVDAL